jgi:signal transduction histidine kinase
MTILDLHRGQPVGTLAALRRAVHAAHRSDRPVPGEKPRVDETTRRAHPAPGTGTSGGWEETPEERLRHDLRQSLGLVMALTAGVQQNIGQVTEVLGCLRQMRHETERMTALVAAEVEGTTGPQHVDVGRIVADTWRSAAAAAPCRLQLVCDAGTRAVLDPVALARSVQNLLDNAVRAAGDGGAVVVAVRDHGDSVTVSVTDTGPGFGNVPTQQGLGLVTVRRFAAACGGTLEVARPPHGGAELVLRIPSATPTGGGLTCAS